MRYEGVSKMGFYATPTSMVEKIISRLQFAGPSRLFDPCCGEGDALAEVGKVAPDGSATYGIELDGQRAEKARRKLHHTVTCAYERARVETAGMQFCWLNPPYDQQSGLGGLAFRKELIFLRDISKFVAADGVLVFIIPRYTLGQDMVNALVNRFTDLAVYQFDDAEYAAYKQVVVFGRRRAKSLSSLKQLTEAERLARNDLMMYGKDEDEPMPYLDEPDRRTWTVPHSESMDTSIIFRGYILDEDELVQDLSQSEVFRMCENLLSTAVQHTALRRPLLPFRRTHMATLISAGALNGAVGVADNRHMVVGITRKVVEREIVLAEDGKEPTIVDTENYVTVVRTIQPNGIIRDLA